MMHRRTLLLAGATLFLTACARTLVEPLSSTRGVEPEKMQKIIREALLRRSWIVVREESGVTYALIKVKDKIAAIKIEYSESRYSIHLDPSQSNVLHPNGQVDRPHSRPATTTDGSLLLIEKSNNSSLQ